MYLLQALTSVVLFLACLDSLRNFNFLYLINHVSLADIDLGGVVVFGVINFALKLVISLYFISYYSCFLQALTLVALKF